MSDDETVMLRALEGGYFDEVGRARYADRLAHGATGFERLARQLFGRHPVGYGNAFWDAWRERFPPVF